MILKFEMLNFHHVAGFPRSHHICRSHIQTQPVLAVVGFSGPCFF